MSAVTQPTCGCLLGLAAIAPIPSPKILIIAFLAVPIIGRIDIHFSDGEILYFEFFVVEGHLSFEVFID